MVRVKFSLRSQIMMSFNSKFLLHRLISSSLIDNIVDANRCRSGLLRGSVEKSVSFAGSLNAAKPATVRSTPTISSLRLDRVNCLGKSTASTEDRIFNGLDEADKILDARLLASTDTVIEAAFSDASASSRKPRGTRHIWLTWYQRRIRAEMKSKSGRRERTPANCISSIDLVALPVGRAGDN